MRDANLKPRLERTQPSVIWGRGEAHRGPAQGYGQRPASVWPTERPTHECNLMANF